MITCRIGMRRKMNLRSFPPLLREGQMSLEKLQQPFNASPRGGGSDVEVLGLRETTAFSREERLEIYKYAVLARMREAVIEDFPLCAEVCGDAIEGLVNEYLRHNPSTYASLSEISQNFHLFLRVKLDWPGLSELARFE